MADTTLKSILRFCKKLSQMDRESKKGKKDNDADQGLNMTIWHWNDSKTSVRQQVWKIRIKTTASGPVGMWR